MKKHRYQLIKKSVHLFSGLFALYMLCSCSLTEIPVSEASPETIFNTPTGIRNGLNGVYSKLRDLYGSQKGFTLTTFGTDLFMHGKDGGYKGMDLYNAELNPSMSYLNDLWDDCYQAINAANTILAALEHVQMEENLKNKYAAEARFLRAHFYYWLTLQFGDVVLTQEETTGVVNDLPRTAKQDIWAFMKADTEFAVSQLDWTNEQYGRVTKGASLHQLAKICLLLENGAEAEAAAKTLIDQGPYRLLSRYGDIFEYDNQQNEEIIFAAQYTKDPINNGDGNQGHAFFTPAYDQFPGLMRDVNQGGRPYARFRPTPFFISLFESNDSRSEATFRKFWFYNNSATLPANKQLGDTVLWETSPGVFSTTAPNTVNMHWAIKKHDDPTRASVQDLAGFRDFFIYRLAETYLLLAESLVMQGKTTEAANYLNQVRKRAAYTDTSLTEVNPATLDIDTILDERARELGGEAMRWMDLARTGKLIERVKKYNPNGSGNIKAFHQLRPIPQAQIDLTVIDFPQNEGY